MILNRKRLLVLGQFSLVFGILGFLLNAFFLNNIPIVSFAIGISLGLALVLNLTSLFRFE